MTALPGAPARAAGTDGDRAWERRYGRLLIALDLTGIALAVGLAELLRFGGLHYVGVSATIAACWMLALAANNSRSPRVIGSGVEEYRRVWVATLAAFAGVAIVSMLAKLEIARGYLLIALPVGVAVLLALRWAARRVLIAARRTRGRCIIPVLAVGSSTAVRDLAGCLAAEPWAGYRVVGACITDGVPGSELTIPGADPVTIFGDESDVLAAVEATGSRAVAVTATERLGSHGIRDLSWELEKLDVDLVVAPGAIAAAGPRLRMHPVAGLPLIHVDRPRSRRAAGCARGLTPRR